MKKIELLAEEIRRRQDYLACPICGEPMRLCFPSLLCTQQHCFDLSSKGYITLLKAGGSSANDELYDSRLFEARHAVFSAGIYRPIADTLLHLLDTFLPDKTANILDAGCGEGYYLKYLAALSNTYSLTGIDLSRGGIRAASAGDGSNERILWCVADLARLPFSMDSFDAVLNILTPARYGEFSRVLKPDGFLIKVIPSANYLIEIRERTDSLKKSSYSNEEVLQYAQSHMRLEHREQVTVSQPITPSQWKSLIRMTPLTAHLSEGDMQGLEEHGSDSITLDFTFLVCRNQ